jgi:hypothetical protein
MRGEFDKVLLAAILLILLGVIVAHAGDHDTTQFLETTASGVAGALLGLITGRSMQGSKVQASTDGSGAKLAITEADKA